MAVKRLRPKTSTGAIYAKAKQLEAICWNLKLKGYQTGKIAEETGLSTARITSILRRVNTKMESMVDGWDIIERRTQLARLDENITRLSQMAEDAYELYSSLCESDGLCATEEEVAAAREAYMVAWDRLQKADERRAKLLGLDVVKENTGPVGPQKIEVHYTNYNGIQQLTPGQGSVLPAAGPPVDIDFKCLPAPQEAVPNQTPSE